MLYRCLTSIILLLTAVITVLSRCVSTPPAPPDPRGEAFAGSTACLDCHHDITNSYLHTAHALTSRPATAQSIKGRFPAEYDYGPHGRVLLQRYDSNFYQTAVHGQRTEAHRFDIVIGSGRKAQTYLYWQGDAAYELPVSYFVTGASWANSPEFPADSIWFGRAIATECFECHASFIRNKPAVHTDAFHQTDQFARTTLLYGIDCERCHGPAAQHVAWQTKHPLEKQPRFITRLSTLTRQQRLDACAVCHSGIHTEQLSLFRFRPGDAFSAYYYAEPVRNYDTATMDVHGNQYQLLLSSECFKRSTNLQCNTCHDPHRQERESMTVFVRRCLSCHSPLPPHKGMDSALVLTKCIDCHMPARPSGVITLQTAAGQKPVPDLIRTHRIAIYH